MKITGIDIGEYRQFKNIKFDFTYPDNYHVVEKRGQPLDKVCFIGQSGTGKTTLLNVIWDFLDILSKATEPHDGSFGKLKVDSFPLSFQFNEAIFSTVYHVDIGFSKQVFDCRNISNRGDSKIFLSDWIRGLSSKEGLLFVKKLGLYIKDSISREADAFLVEQEGMPKRLVTTTGQAAEDKAAYLNWITEAGSQKNIALGDMDTVPIWLYLLNDIIEYDEATPSFLLKLGRNSNERPGDTVNELQAWLAKNPRHILAKDCLSPILEKFFLELSLAGESKAPISLKTKAGVQIPNNTLSTGTRQILATAIPIYKFDTKDTVILFDEPERSLFPDIQRALVKYYTGLAPEAQFFFATHSPIIAAAFEPEERFILHFNENGEVAVRRGVAPIGDDPNDILRSDFGLSEVMLDEGLAAYDRYRKLFVEIKNEKDPVRKKELMVEQAKLSDDYKF